MLGRSEGTLRNWRTKGEGPAWTSVGARVFYREDVINAYLDESAERGRRQQEERRRRSAERARARRAAERQGHTIAAEGA